MYTSFLSQWFLFISVYDDLGIQLQIQTKCAICGQLPAKLDRMKLVDNCENVCKTTEGSFLLCGLCESYIHFYCYCVQYRVKQSEKVNELEQFLSGKMIYKCRFCRNGNIQKQKVWAMTKYIISLIEVFLLSLFQRSNFSIIVF